MFYTSQPTRCFRQPGQRFGTILLLLLLTLSGCSGTTDDLFPSGTDKRTQVVAGESGGRPGNTAPNFALITTDNQNFTLSDYRQGGAKAADAVVLYFTMWCPICSAHMDHIQFDIMPKFADAKITYLAVDYLSGSTALTRQSQQESGFSGGKWLAAADPGQVVTNIFTATMGTTVVIDRNGVVRMNEDFRTGENLTATLKELTGTP